MKQRISFIKDKSDEKFGENLAMYYFYCKDYKVSFLINEKENTITEQIEFKLIFPSKKVCSNFYELSYFKEFFNHFITAIYSDNTNETVIFMKSGVNVYFQKNMIEKITSKSEISRTLVMKTMNYD